MSSARRRGGGGSPPKRCWRRELARYTLTDVETWAHPAVIQGGLIVKSYDRLIRFDF
ncbi:MAG: hypothetical protein GY719_23990 [bacterium]|nr:hypothetical protein [bacterium]